MGRGAPELSAPSTTPSPSSAMLGVADFLNLPRNAPLLEQSVRFATAARGRYDDVVAARHRRLGARTHRAPARTVQARLERAVARRARWLSASPRAREHRSGDHQRGARSRRSREHALHRHLQIRRHRGDDVAVPHCVRPRQEREPRHPGSLRLRHRSCARRAAPDRWRAPRPSARHSARRWRALQRPHARRNAPRCTAGHRRRAR